MSIIVSRRFCGQMYPSALRKFGNAFIRSLTLKAAGRALPPQRCWFFSKTRPPRAGTVGPHVHATHTGNSLRAANPDPE